MAIVLFSPKSLYSAVTEITVLQVPKHEIYSMGRLNNECVSDISGETVFGFAATIICILQVPIKTYFGAR